MNKREKQRQERKEQILLCSMDMIISRGYEATKIRDIAKRLGISTGLFFNYFESKEKVYEELVKIGVSGPENILQLSLQKSSPLEIFQTLTAAIFDSIRSYSFTAKMFMLMVQAIHSEATPESVKKIVGTFDMMAPVLPIIEQGQQNGEFKKGDTTALAVAYWGAIQGIAESIAVHPALPLPEVDWIMDILKA